MHRDNKTKDFRRRAHRAFQKRAVKLRMTTKVIPDKREEIEHEFGCDFCTIRGCEGQCQVKEERQ
jgi:hypothetical protein